MQRIYGRKNIGKHAFFVLLSLFVCVIWMLSSIRADEKNGFLYEITLDQKQALLSSSDLPVTISFFQVTKTQKLIIDVTLPDIDSNYFVYRKEVLLEKDKDQKIQMVVPVRYETSRFRVQLLDENYSELLAVYLYPEHQETSSGTIALSGLFIGQRTIFKPKSISFSFGETKYSVYPSFESEDMLAEDICYLREYRLICMGYSQLQNLSSEKQKALHTWVGEGGLLLVNAAKDSKLLSDGKSSEVIFSGDGAVVFFEENYYSGKLFVENTLQNMLTEAVKLLPEKLVAATLGSNIKAGWTNNMWETLQTWKFSIPALKIYVFVLAFYEFVALPGAYMFLKGIQKRYYMRGTIILLAVIFGAIIYIMGANTRINQNYITTLQVRLAEEKYDTIQMYSSCQTAYGVSQKLLTSPEWELHPMLLPGAVSEEKWSKVTTGDCSMLFSYESDQTICYSGNQRIGTNFLFAEKTVLGTEEAMPNLMGGVFLRKDGSYAVLDQKETEAFLHLNQEEKGKYLQNTSLLWKNASLEEIFSEDSFLNTQLSDQQKKLYQEYLDAHDYLLNRYDYLFLGFGQKEQSSFIINSSECQSKEYILYLQLLMND